VGDLLQRVGLDPSEARISDVAHNRWLTSGIWHVTTPSGPVVLKHLSAAADAGDTPMTAHWTARSASMTHWSYWAREALAYQHRLTDAYRDSGIGAPELLAIDGTDTDFVLLLEFVEGVPAERWAIDQYASVSAALGRAQGSFLTGRPAPRHAWLSRGFVIDYSTEKPVDWSLLYDDAAWAQPLVRRNFPRELRYAAIWLHESRERLYAIMADLPRTLSHLDFWTKNLIRRSDGSFALLDWAFVGDGAIGEDVGNLVPDAAFDHFLAASDLPALDTAVGTAYLQGLEDAGWDDDPRLIQLGMWASAVKYDWLTPMMLVAGSEPIQRGYGGAAVADPDQRFRERGEALLHNAETASRAVALAGELELGT